MSIVRNGPSKQVIEAVLPKTKVAVVLGSQWGDEGKGKLVDILATTADVVCRCQVILFVFVSLAVRLFYVLIVRC